MMYIVYQIQNETANITLCLHPSIEEKSFMMRKS